MLQALMRSTGGAASPFAGAAGPRPLCQTVRTDLALPPVSQYAHAAKTGS